MQGRASGPTTPANETRQGCSNLSGGPRHSTFAVARPPLRLRPINELERIAGGGAMAFVCMGRSDRRQRIEAVCRRRRKRTREQLRHQGASSGRGHVRLESSQPNTFRPKTSSSAAAAAAALRRVGAEADETTKQSPARNGWGRHRGLCVRVLDRGSQRSLRVCGERQRASFSEAGTHDDCLVMVRDERSE